MSFLHWTIVIKGMYWSYRLIIDSCKVYARACDCLLITASTVDANPAETMHRKTAFIGRWLSFLISQLEWRIEGPFNQIRRANVTNKMFHWDVNYKKLHGLCRVVQSRFNTDVFVSTLRFFRLLQFFLLFLHAFYITKPFSQRRTIEIC